MKYLFIIIITVAVLGGAWYALSEPDASGQAEATDQLVDRTFEAKEPVRADGTFTISTSFYPLQFALEEIAGDAAEITNVGAGRDPHDFRPSTQAIRTLQSSDLVVLQGAGFEPWGENVRRQLADNRTPVVVVTEELALRESEDDHHDEHDDQDDQDEHEEHHEDDEYHDVQPESEEHDEHRAEVADDHEHNSEAADQHDAEHAHGLYDPHTWLDPVLFSETVGHVAEALATLDPKQADVYAANAAALQDELATLDRAYETRLTNCTYDEVIVSHDALGYVASRYNLDLHPIAGLSTQDTPSARTLARLREAAAEGMGAILLEESSVTAYGDTLARETGLATYSFNPVSFALPADENYLTVMEANLDALSAAFACDGTN